MTKKMSLLEMKKHLQGKDIAAISYNIDTQSSEGYFPYGDLHVTFPFMYVAPCIGEILLADMDENLLTGELMAQMHQNAPADMLINTLKLSCVEYVDMETLQATLCAECADRLADSLNG